MRVTRTVLVNTVAFGVASTILFIMLAVRILPTVFGDTYSVYGLFPEAGGVFTNQEVTYRGVQVGRVGEMTLSGKAVKIELVIEQGFQIPRLGTRAQVLYKSAVGEQFVDLVPNTQSAPYFQGGEVIPLSMTSLPVQIEDLLRQLDLVLGSVDPAALGTVIHELGSGLRGHGQDLKELLLALDTLAAIGANNRAQISLGIRSAADLQDSFNSTSEDFVSASGSLADAAKVLAEKRAELARTLDANRVLDREINGLLERRKTEIDRLVADVGALTRLMHNQRGDLDLVLKYLGPFLNDIYSTYHAPYFLFNLLTNADGPACTYKNHSGERPVYDTSNQQPSTTFECDPSYASASQKLSWRALYEIEE